MPDGVDAPATQPAGAGLDVGEDDDRRPLDAIGRCLVEARAALGG